MANYFIKVEDGPEVRRKILESSKASLHTLRGYHELLRIRGEKLSHMNALRAELKELTMLLNRVEALMPTLTERELEELRPKPLPVAKQVPIAKAVAKAPKPEGKWVQKGNRKVFIAAPKARIVTEVPVPMPELPPVDEPKPKARPLTELEKLEAALKGVESKLGNL